MASYATSVLLLVLSSLLSSEAVPPDKPKQDVSPVDVAVNLNVTELENEVAEATTTTRNVIEQPPATTTVKPAKNETVSETTTPEPEIIPSSGGGDASSSGDDDSSEFNMEGRTKACNLLIGIDEPLYDLYERDMDSLYGMAYDHVAFANKIFGEQVFTEAEGLADRYFRIGRIQVIFGSCESLELVEEKNCTAHRDSYLKFFDRYDHRDFCLAYAFTYRDFHNGTAGLAHTGTVCYPTQNSGFVTLLNYGQNRSMEESYLTFVHELGHSFGSKHDKQYEDAECADDDGFIMTETQSNDLSAANARTFSSCSLGSFKNKMAEATTDCFSEPDDPDAKPVISLCGNGIVEEGEECDCGTEFQDCNDLCCYAAHVDPHDRFANKTAIPCSRNEKWHCRHPPGIIFGLYVPWAFIAASSVVAAVIFNRDWKGQKKFFRHITHGNIRIVR